MPLSIGAHRSGNPIGAGTANKAHPTPNLGQPLSGAAGTPTPPNLHPPRAPAAKSSILQPAETTVRNIQPSGKLTKFKEFDDESRKLTEPHYNALNNTLRNAREYFDRQRQLPAYTAFKQDRDGAHTAGTDLTLRDSYIKVAQTRSDNTAALDQDNDGRSDLERLLPPDSPFRSVLEPATGSIRDIETGLNADLSKIGNPPTYRLTFPGTGLVDTNGTQWGMNIRQFLGIGGVPAAFQDALKLAQEIQKSLPSDAKLELDGHSLGGGIATYVGLKIGVKVVGFHSAMLGPACMKDLRESGCLTEERLAHVHQVRLEGDLVTSRRVNRVFAAMARFGVLLPSHAPKLLGTVHQISASNPAHPKFGMIETHMPQAFELAYKKR